MNRFDVLALSGLLLIAAGAALVYLPAGLIAAGVFSVALGVGGRPGGRK